jgi:hypothetical protein
VNDYFQFSTLGYLFAVNGNIINVDYVNSLLMKVYAHTVKYMYSTVCTLQGSSK